MSRILVVDRDVETCQVLADVFRRDGETTVWHSNPHQALAHVSREPVDVALLDVRMPERGGFELLRNLRAVHPSLPVIVMTSFGSIDSAVQAMALGAFDYVSKPIDLRTLGATVRKALRQSEPQAALPEGGDDLGGLIGRSPAMVEVYKAIARVAPGSSTVLILGESGTGKELVARALHRHSVRRMKAFVAVNCAGLPEPLLESELFGHIQGAFTDAVADNAGLFAEADGSSILLDEIGDVLPSVQAKLLRVLQERAVRPVGGTRSRSVDVRVLAATNHDLAAAVAAGTFREDLYYRLRVVTIQLPSLRERREDIPLLVGHFIRRVARESRNQVGGVSEPALDLLQAYHWPGNVRELGHVIERSMALAQHDVLGAEDLPPEVRTPGVDMAPDILADHPTLAILKRRYIEQVLDEDGGNVSRAAAVLGLDRHSLYRMLRRYGIAPHRPE